MIEAETTIWPYPALGQVAVMDSGLRVAVWPNESESSFCFTGQALLPNRTNAQIAVHDVSCMWSRAHIHHVEPPTDADRAMSIYPFEQPEMTKWTMDPTNGNQPQKTESQHCFAEPLVCAPTVADAVSRWNTRAQVQPQRIAAE